MAKDKKDKPETGWFGGLFGGAAKDLRGGAMRNINKDRRPNNEDEKKDKKKKKSD